MAAEQDDMMPPGRRVSLASQTFHIFPEQSTSHSSQVSFSITSELMFTPINVTQPLCLRTEIRGPAGQPPIVTSTPLSAIQTLASSFPKFMELPPEVRKMIWVYSFGGPRIFRLVPCTEQLVTWATMFVNHKPPSSGAACRESRQVFQQCGEFLFGAEGLAIKSLWFRPSEDILYLDHILVEYLEHERYYSGCDFTSIENVAINWRGKSDKWNLQRLADALVKFPSCKRMILVMSHGPPPDEGDVEFFHIMEDDRRKALDYSIREPKSEASTRIKMSPTKTVATESTPLTFPLFERLPPEIRAMIWEYSFGEARIFKTTSTSIVSGIIPMAVNHKPPPSSQACKEARMISQKIGQFLFGAYGSPYKSLWFNPSQDIFWWDREVIAWDEMIINGHFIDCVENVALDLSDRPEHCFDMVRDMCHIFPFCKTLQLVLQHKQELGGNVQFLKVSDNSQVSIKGHEGVVPWEVIEENFEEDYAIAYGDIDMQVPRDAQPPRFEVVEVVPIRDGEN
ncbi:hypothetical protein CEP52_000150 [Fusarium oligoseptatum]|uniref:2EXR domain-containing protein n=1 Tax=Fusarium oligoseptatum TaxID=2604345 RepID=A0A428UPP7_9HYPO|nr:hypothetical protein CEP52_000150 [Fusarium oligoseptatum]